MQYCPSGVSWHFLIGILKCRRTQAEQSHPRQDWPSCLVHIDTIAPAAAQLIAGRTCIGFPNPAQVDALLVDFCKGSIFGGQRGTCYTSVNHQITGLMCRKSTSARVKAFDIIGRRCSTLSSIQKDTGSRPRPRSENIPEMN